MEFGNMGGMALQREEHYPGYVTSKGDEIAQESSSIRPEEFYARYIKARRPVVLRGMSSQEEWARMQKLADLSYLRQTARSSTVKIEPVNPATGTFGSSMPRRTVLFPRFLDILSDETQRGKWYLTTQYEEEDAKPVDQEWNADMEIVDETPVELDPICPPPTDALVGDFPRRPKIMGNLVLQQSNLWIGNSPEGSSSGLHHDFHDNLYILLRGRKRFVLYPPSAYPYLHLRGNIERLHPNGLLSYTLPSGPTKVSLTSPCGAATRADGLDPLDAATWRVRYWDRKMQEMKASAKASTANGLGKRASSKALAKLQERYERAVDDMMMLQLDEMGSEGDEEMLDEEGASGEDAEEESDEDAEPLFGNPDAEDSDFDDDFSMGDDAEDIIKKLGVEEDIEDGEDQEPPSFSRIAASALHRHLGLATNDTSSNAQFGKQWKKKKDKHKAKPDHAVNELLPLAGCPPPLVVSLEPGDMLYLPTSWFHEVTSSSDDNGSTHIAFNYWFHPPDGFVASSPSTDTEEWTGIDWERGSFERPYRDGEVWEEIALAVESKMDELLEQRRSMDGMKPTNNEKRKGEAERKIRAAAHGEKGKPGGEKLSNVGTKQKASGSGGEGGPMKKKRTG
ncbi:Clavaminate synthase-like protein [Punctularia strigosozonata HHB-11173 SS5]|uniref:Clavaminate synthase-like protein n=1 Tax=Punctularia strigosozonata (strain HHB-11173) TaxID=741275 RepID=UPI0004416CA8|nr:Clavaminate synthase-like protein [Punctularia strigosozonata HHB-11173 SS5]EIN14656.1 Clavaminate synthase-like protein [Punctularia strigosozonata HHB-11173 SS5]